MRHTTLQEYRAEQQRDALRRAEQAEKARRHREATRWWSANKPKAGD
jgi:hypothetical protein